MDVQIYPDYRQTAKIHRTDAHKSEEALQKSQTSILNSRHMEKQSDGYSELYSSLGTNGSLILIVIKQIT